LLRAGSLRALRVSCRSMKPGETGRGKAPTRAPTAFIRPTFKALSMAHQGLPCRLSVGRKRGCAAFSCLNANREISTGQAQPAWWLRGGLSEKFRGAGRREGEGSSLSRTPLGRPVGSVAPPTTPTGPRDPAPGSGYLYPATVHAPPPWTTVRGRPAKPVSGYFFCCWKAPADRRVGG